MYSGVKWMKIKKDIKTNRQQKSKLIRQRERKRERETKDEEGERKIELDNKNERERNRDTREGERKGYRGKRERKIE